jgi:hypothetical protein
MKDFTPESPVKNATRTRVASAARAPGTAAAVAMRFAIATVGVISIAALVSSLRGERSGEDLAMLTEQVSALREALAQEKQARAALEDEFGLLRARLAQAPAPAQVAAPAPAPVAKPPAQAEEPRSPSFDPQRVIAAGVSASDVERFRARVAEIELARLHLRDRARREGWVDTPAYEMQSRRIEGELYGLREEFDEDLYDWMRFAEGQPNRVSVTEVLAGSAADSAGLRRGDLIVRYDDRLVFSPAELSLATSAGEAGATVEVEVQRDAESLRVFVPRGPLGVRLEPLSVAPAPSR